jgi:hypothetical protein
MKKIILLTAIIILASGCSMVEKKGSDTIELKINDETWQAVKDFSNSAADDKHYVLRTEEDGTSVIIFGDGTHGRRPSSETSQIKARYDRSSNRHYVGIYGQQGRIKLDNDNTGNDCK